MKKLIITGKSNIEAIQGVKEKKRATMKDISDSRVFDIKTQIDSIKKIYGELSKHIVININNWA